MILHESQIIPEDYIPKVGDEFKWISPEYGLCFICSVEKIGLDGYFYVDMIYINRKLYGGDGPSTFSSVRDYYGSYDRNWGFIWRYKKVKDTKIARRLYKNNIVKIENGELYLKEGE